MLQAWDINTHAELTLNELAGPVYAMVVGHNMLFVGTEVTSSEVLNSYDLILVGSLFD